MIGIRSPYGPFFGPLSAKKPHGTLRVSEDPMSKKVVNVAIVALLTTFAVSARADYTVHAKGRLVYKQAGQVKPVPRARVKLMDQDSDLDETMAAGKTDDNGNYDLTGKAEDDFTVCDGCDHPDPYVKFIMFEKDRVDIHNIWGFTHFGLTNAREDKSGTIDFGTFRFEADEELYPKLFAYVQMQYAKFTELTGESRVPGYDGKVGVTVPEVFEGGVPWTGVENIHWPGDYASTNDMDAVFHEFGHRIRHAADGDVGHFLGDAMLFRYARSHSMKDHSNLGFAFNEGWAEYHATLLDSGAKDYLAGWTSQEGGDETEGNVAKKLFDLSQQCGGFKNMWAALKAGTNKSISGGPAAAQTGIHSYAQFETQFKQLFPWCGKTVIDPSKLGGMDKIPLPKPAAVAPTLTKAALSTQTANLAKVITNFGARAGQPVKVKWDAARIAKLPAPLQGPMKRLVDKRTAHLRTHETNLRTQLLAFNQSIKPATTQTAIDGTYERSISAARDALIKATGEPRMRQLAELKQDLAKERAATTDRRFQAYADRLTARYTAQENEIRAALSKPGSPFPEALITRNLGSALTNAP
jgi:hypothetical protein